MIRVAAETDIDKIVKMGIRFISETGYAGKIGVNMFSMEEVARRVMKNGILFVDELAGVVVGMLGAIAFEHPMSGERIASEVFWWVEPENRGGGVALLRAMEHWAREQKATRLQMIAPTEKVGKFYERVGFYEVETTYQKELK